MTDDFKEFLELPGTPQEQEWLKERLETLSVRESYALAAVSMGYPPEKAADAIKSILSLPDCTLHPAGSYEDLGKYSQKGAASLPEDVLPYVDFDHIGQKFEDEHPGLFIGGYYVEYPKRAAEPAYSGKNAFLPEDSDWSVKLKLASPAVPEGVWLRLPGYDGKIAEDADEVVLALDELRVKSLEDCTLLEARCILPEAGDLTKQYSSITDLVRDGDNLGYVLAEQGQGKAHWLDKFAAALEYEDCRTLKFALDISQNLRCYEWVPSSGIKEFAANNLRSCGVPEELIQSGNIDLDAYAEDLLERSGYMETGSETGYLTRNGREFVRDLTAPAQQDVLKAVPMLEKMSSQAVPEDAAAARAAIAEALAGRGECGLRQLQAAMESEDCASLEEAVEIAGRLDSYEFVEIGSFREKAEKELLEKGLDKKVIDRCVDFTAYAALTHEFESIYSSRNTGLYVRRNGAMSRPEQGMTMQ
jgi:hypothetical protein